MFLKSFTVLALCLTALPALAQDSEPVDGWEPPPPAMVDGWDQTQTVALVNGIRRLPELEPSCGDHMVNGEEICDPTAFGGLLGNLCNEDCELTVSDEKFSCVMDSFTKCNAEAREEISALIEKINSGENETDLTLEDLRQQGIEKRDSCYQAAETACQPSVDNTIEVTTGDDHPEINGPEAPLAELSGSGCSLSKNGASDFHWGWALGLACLLNGILILRKHS